MKTERQFVVCIKNNGFEVSLEIGKKYEVVPDEDETNMIRIIDESGEDYLYPKEYFEIIKE